MTDDGSMSVFAKFGLDVTDFIGGLEKSQNGILAFYRDVTVSINMTMQIFDRVIAKVQEFGQMAQELKDFSYQTGLSTDKIQQMQYAAVLAGTNFGTVQMAVNRLTISIGEAANASSAAAKDFSALGITTSGKTVDQIFDDTAKSLINVRDVTERNRIANDLFGRSYKDLLPYLDTYISKQKEISEHPGLSKVEIDQLEEGKVAWDKLTSSFTIYSGKVLAFVEGSAWKKLSESHTALPEAIRSQMTAMEELTYQTYGIVPERLQSLVAETLSKKPFASSQSGVVSELTDKYAGLTDQQIDLMDATDALTKAQEDQAAALKSGDIDAYNTASRAVQTYKNRVQDLTQALQENKTVSGESTYNTQFASSIQDGGVGPDAAGYSDLANMTPDQLREIAKGGLGKSKSFAERAQAYLDRMGASSGTSSSGATTATKSVSPADQATADTGTLTTELDKQAALFGTLSDKIKDSWITTEKNALIHWTAMSEFARISMQKLMDDWGTTVEFVDSNVAYEQTITMMNGVSAANPIAVPTISVPTLASADFSKVSALGGGKTGRNEGTSGDKSGSPVTVNVKVENETTVNSKITASVSDSMAQVIAVNGGTAGL